MIGRAYKIPRLFYEDFSDLALLSVVESTKKSGVRRQDRGCHAYLEGFA